MIYLDHNATSPLLPDALDAMLPWLRTPANPSSVHAAGRQAARAIREATGSVAALVGCDPRDIIFTSGATEANHLWFHGRVGPVAIGATEHPSVFAAAGERARVIPVGPDGLHGPVPDGVCGVSMMAANHETGVVSRLPERRDDRWLHVDGTAAAGRLRLSFATMDALTLSAHKIGGPVGVGALISRDHELPAMFTGSQQRGRRAGTLNTPGIVGFGVAARLAREQFDDRQSRWKAQQARLFHMVGALGGRVLGPPGLPTVVNAVFAGVPAELVVQSLDLRGICVSAGSACSSGSVASSPVLVAMREPHLDGGIRISLGWSTTDADITAICEALPDVIATARSFLQ